MQLRSFRRNFVVAALALAGITCSTDTTGPGGGHDAQVRVEAILPAAAHAARVPLGQATLTVVRAPAETLLSQTVAYDSGAVVDLPVELDATSEDLDVTLTLLMSPTSGFPGVAAFRGRDTITVTGGTPGAAVPVAVQYIGPGATAAAVRIMPRDSTLATNDTLFLLAGATNGAGGPLPAPYVLWSTSAAGTTVRQDGRFITPGIRGSTMLLILSPTGLRDSTLVRYVPPPSQLVKQVGDSQQAEVQDTLTQQLVVVVRAADALPVPGVAVTFAAATGGGSVTQATVVSDSLGVARTRAILGTTSGAQSFTATVAGVTPAIFTATALPGAPAAIAKVSGDAQADTAGQALAAPLVVRVTDAFDNPVAGAVVRWTRRVGTGALTPDSSITTAAGLAQATYTLGVPGADTLRATLGATAAFVEFRVTAVPGNLLVTIAQGNGQSDTVGQVLADSLAVTVTDQASGAPMVGRFVHFTILTGVVTLSADSIATTDSGRSAVRVTIGEVAGPITIRATTAGATAPVTFTATAVPGAAQQLRFVVEPSDTVSAGLVLAPAPVVQVADTFGNSVALGGVSIAAALAGVTAASGEDSLTTDSTGRATFDSLVISGAVGNDELRFDAAGLESARWTIHVRAGAAAALAKAAGDTQTAYLDSLVAVAPRVRVVDAFGNVVSGTTVHWSVVAGAGSVTGASVVSDTLGEGAVGSWRLGPVVGENRLRARITGIDSLEFTATGAPLPPAITLQLRDTVVGMGRTVGLELHLAAPAPAGGVSITLSNNAPGVMSLDSTSITVAAGDTLGVVTLTGLSGGAATIGATAPGYLGGSLVVPATADVVNLPATFSVNYRGGVNMPVSLAQVAPTGGVTVTLASLDTTKVKLVAPTTQITAGQQNAIALLQGIRPGTAQVVATAPGFLPDTVWVTSVA
ncbi:MAG: Ig-like domain-containing protein, partial [Actinomycetota bacterium]|nr:Ig-like domain-containing protein [Actinomycetota bacterium]